MKTLDEGSAYAEYDQSARLENEDGDITTFYQIMMKQKGGGDVEKAEVVMEDDEGNGIHAYRVEGSLFRPVNPELIAEARNSDEPIGRIRERRAEDESDQPAPSA